MPGQLDLRLAGGFRRGEDLLMPSAQSQPSHSGSPPPSAGGRGLGGRWCCGQWWGPMEASRGGQRAGGIDSQSIWSGSRAGMAGVAGVAGVVGVAGWNGESGAGCGRL